MNRAILLILLLVSPAFGQKAVITCPAERQTGELTIIKTTGTVGNDPKIVCFPANDDWIQVTMADGSVGVILSTNKPGKYTFILAVNLEGKTGLGDCTVNIVSPGPRPDPIPTPVDSFLNSLKNGYDMDLAAGVGTKENKQLLSANYSQAADILVSQCKTLQEVQDLMHKKNDDLIGAGRLPMTRKAIAEDVIKALGTDGTVAIDAKKIRDQWKRISDYLNKVP